MVYETWAYSKAIHPTVNAIELWCFRRMLRISWTPHNTNNDVGLLQNIGVNETTMVTNFKPRNMSYAGHMIRNTSGENYYANLLRTMEGRLEDKRGKWRSRRTWFDDMRDWTGSKRYDQVKGAAKTKYLYDTFVTNSTERSNE